MSSRKILLLLLVILSFISAANARYAFLDHVKNSTLVHHVQTNTVWEYIGSYSQTDSTINYITGIPVFQFLCDVIPVRMAYGLKTCLEYRNLLLKNSDVTRLKEVAEDHAKSRTKRQLVQGLIAGGAAYTIYRVVGDLLGPSNQHLAHRLDDVENFEEHQQALNAVMNTVIASLQNNQFTFVKAFKDVYDDANVTRQYLYQHIRQVIAFRNEYDSFAKHAIVQEMRNHYDKIVHSISRVEEHKLNLDFLSPDQRSITYDFVYQKVKALLPENFGESLSLFIPKLLVHQILSFNAVNESSISYELTEKDFQFDISVDPKFERMNQTVDLDEIIPKIVGHLQVENIFGLPQNLSEKKSDLFKVTRLPYFVTSEKAIQISHIPTYFTLDADGYSSEWETHDKRQCTFDKQSKFMFCAVPTVIYSQIQNPCIRSIVFDNDTSECFRDEIDMFSPQNIRLSPNVFAVSTDSKLQCLEKISQRENVWTNISKVGIIKTKCNSYISCGKFDFRSDDICADENSYILSIKESVAPYRLGESVNEAQSNILSLKNFLNVTAMLSDIDLDEELRQKGFLQFQRGISTVIESKWSLTIVVSSIVFLILLVAAFCFLPRFYPGRCFADIFWCFQRRSFTTVSERENKLRSILCESLLHIGNAARQLPPPVPPRNRSNSFLEKSAIYSRCPNNDRAFEQFRTDEHGEIKYSVDNSVAVAYDSPAIEHQVNDSQCASHIPRLSCYLKTVKNLEKIPHFAHQIKSMNDSIATSGSFFEEDKYNLNIT